MYPVIKNVQILPKDCILDIKIADRKVNALGRAAIVVKNMLKIHNAIRNLQRQHNVNNVHETSLQILSTPLVQEHST